MKTIDPALLAMIQGGAITLAYCWLITRKDNVKKAFTSADQDLVIDGITYQSAVGFAPTAARSTRDFSANTVETDTWFEAITDTDLQLGKYDYARVQVFLVDYTDPPANLNTGTGGPSYDSTYVHDGSISYSATRPNNFIALPTGYLGQVSQTDFRLKVEVRGLSDLLNQKIGNVVSPTCLWSLGDTKCRVNLASYTFTGSITSIANKKTLTASALNQATNYYAGGLLTFTTGANAGGVFEIASSAAGQMQLFIAPPFAMAVGDQFAASAGCNKTTGGLASNQKVIAKSITVIVDPVTFQSGVTGADGLYNGGTLSFTSGANVGRSFTVASFTSTNGVIALGSTPPSSIAVSDRFTLTQAVAPTVGNGCLFYNNIANYGGFPSVPGNDRALAGYSANSSTTPSTNPGSGGSGGGGGGGGGVVIE